QRVRLVDHPHFAEAAASVVRHELDEGELAPRSADDGGVDLDDSHADSCSTVRRSCSVCWRWSRIAWAAALGLRASTASRIAWCCSMTSSTSPPRARWPAKLRRRLSRSGSAKASLRKTSRRLPEAAARFSWKRTSAAWKASALSPPARMALIDIS